MEATTVATKKKLKKPEVADGSVTGATIKQMRLSPVRLVKDFASFLRIKPDVVYSTTEYDAFENFPSNRTLDKHKVNRIRKSMDSAQGGKLLISPILVNENLQIIDGQHRFAAIQQLNAPLHFIMRPGLTEDDIPLYNSNAKNWVAKDYLKVYAEQGREAYIVLNEFINKHDLSLANGIRFLTGSRYVDDRAKNSRNGERVFKEGNLTLDLNYDPQGEKLRDFLKFRALLKQHDPHFANYADNQRFAMAFMDMVEHPDFKIAALEASFRLTHMPMMASLLDAISHGGLRRVDYLNIFEKMYNFKKRGESLYFTIKDKE